MHVHNPAVIKENTFKKPLIIRTFRNNDSKNDKTEQLTSFVPARETFPICIGDFVTYRSNVPKEWMMYRILGTRPTLYRIMMQHCTILNRPMKIMGYFNG